MTDDVKKEKKEAKGHILSVTDFSLKRRQMLGALAGCAGLLVAGSASYGIFSFLNSKPVGEIKPVKMKLADLPLGKPVNVLYGGQPAHIVRSEQGILAFSLVCTHLGCLVIWEPENNRFYCPCHDAVFSPEGAVQAGPPSLPLEKLKVVVSGSDVIIGGV